MLIALLPCSLGSKTCWALSRCLRNSGTSARQVFPQPVAREGLYFTAPPVFTLKAGC